MIAVRNPVVRIPRLYAVYATTIDKRCRTTDHVRELIAEATPHRDGARRIRIAGTAAQRQRDIQALRDIAERLQAANTLSPADQRAAARAAETVLRQLARLTRPNRRKD